MLGWPVVIVWTGLALIMLALPARAWAHGSVDPEASVDLARITHVPPGVRVRVVDGDLRLWMSAPPDVRITVVDYQGAPYLRWTPRGVYANESSPMFYLNLSPPITPSISLTRSTAPTWHLVTRGHSYVWHDGRVAALSESLAAPDARVLGHWSIPLEINGHAANISGVLDHRPRPTFAWLWPAAVIILILPALLRLRDPALERRLLRIVTAVTLLGVLVLSVGAGLHGRPGLSPTLIVPMAVELLLAVWSGWRLIRGHHDAVTIGLVAALALFRAISGIALLWRNYALLAVPALMGRIAVSICLAGGICLTVGVIAAVDRLRPGTRAPHLRTTTQGPG
jgi:hypothetical protein